MEGVGPAVDVAVMTKGVIGGGEQATQAHRCGPLDERRSRRQNEMTGSVEMRPARAQQAKLNRSRVGNSERQDPLRLEPVGGGGENLGGVGEVLQHVPHRDHARLRQAVQRANRIVAADRPYAEAIRHIATAPVVHLDRRDLEAGA